MIGVRKELGIGTQCKVHFCLCCGRYTRSICRRTDGSHTWRLNEYPGVLSGWRGRYAVVIVEAAICSSNGRNQICSSPTNRRSTTAIPIIQTATTVATKFAYLNRAVVGTEASGKCQHGRRSNRRGRTCARCIAGVASLRCCQRTRRSPTYEGDDGAGDGTNTWRGRRKSKRRQTRA